MTFLVGVNRKTWTFAFAVTAGFALETVGRFGFVGIISMFIEIWIGNEIKERMGKKKKKKKKRY